MASHNKAKWARKALQRKLFSTGKTPVKPPLARAKDAKGTTYCHWTGCTKKKYLSEAAANAAIARMKSLNASRTKGYSVEWDETILAHRSQWDKKGLYKCHDLKSKPRSRRRRSSS